jgi:hypothetical protein
MAIVSENRPLVVLFFAFKRVLKNLVCLGYGQIINAKALNHLKRFPHEKLFSRKINPKGFRV